MFPKELKKLVNKYASTQTSYVGITTPDTTEFQIYKNGKPKGLRRGWYVLFNISFRPHSWEYFREDSMYSGNGDKGKVEGTRNGTVRSWLILGSGKETLREESEWINGKKNGLLRYIRGFYEDRREYVDDKVVEFYGDKHTWEWDK